MIKSQKWLASDRDDVSPYSDVRFNLIGDVQALQYFLINENTGDIFQRLAVQSDPDMVTEYNVGCASWLKDVERCVRFYERPCSKCAGEVKR